MPPPVSGLVGAKTPEQFAEEYRRYYDSLATEDARAQLLVFFKERLYKQGDMQCGKLLAELGTRFLSERWKDK